MSVILFALIGAFYIYVTKQLPDASTCIAFAILAAGKFIEWRCELEPRNYHRNT